MGIFSSEERKERARERLASGFWDTPAKVCPECGGNGNAEAPCNTCGVDRKQYRAFFDSLPQREPPAFLLRSRPAVAPPPKHRYVVLLERVESLAHSDYDDARYWMRHYVRLRRLLAIRA